MPKRQRRRLLLPAVTLTALGLATSQALAAPAPHPALPRQAQHQAEVGRQHAAKVQGKVSAHNALTGGDEDGADEAENSAEGVAQYTEARTAPGVVAPGAYGAAWAQLQSMPHVGAAWQHVTSKPYNADDPRYRDINSNSSGGAGYVTGRITGIAADDDGNVYAGGANGGVFRSRTGGGNWEPIADSLPTLSTGTLDLDEGGRLWYATGESNTGATSYVGTGVYVLADPRHGRFAPSNRVGGSELESTVIHALRFGGGKVWAATSRGVWSHSTAELSGPWKLEFAPNPAYLPGGSLAKDPSAPYRNIANDIAIDPKDPSKVVLAIGWRGGDTYNGFYSRAADGSWQRVGALGDLPTDADNVGNVTFARSADGSRYYAIDQSPLLTSTDPDSGLKGIYVSKSGSPYGPWTLIADKDKIKNSGSALTDDGYQPGIQSWYNQFLQVDPTDPDHLYAGLEEVLETKNGGTDWTVPGPYWNFPFSCWSIDPSKQTGDCPPTVHSDQHAVAIGSYRGKATVYVGNDGGIYRRPVDGAADASGHATDWKSLADGTIDTLQYYSVGIGKDPADRSGKGVIVSGGLQDNGESILRAGDKVMGSNFGGDGADTLVDPANGCNIAEEYVYLDMWVTQNCAVNDGAASEDPSKATSYEVAPPDKALGGSGARFIAPITADPKDGNTWVAGGRHVWVQHKGWAIRSGSEWSNAYDLGAGHLATAVATVDGTVYAGWCGPCNNQGFSRGIAVGRTDGTGWHQLNLPVDGTLPNRYISSFAVDEKNAQHVFVAFNGFSRTWTEGPGAGIGHLFETRDGGATWTDVSANLPDVPATSVKILPGGGLVLGTDLAAFYRAPGGKNWKVLGRDLPTTSVQQLKTGPDGRLYAATFGRGIWSIDPRGLIDDNNGQGDDNSRH
ncbi:glycosyl hydrolase [Kitasatospora sp. CB01950]|uniref:glycosyl hydrolase n=1 Tax=Kitasatospora sp. CB01950 TaxID=1703930 RepID=UPI00093AEE36|nr:glycosyl hydrolase [Kitasatospora sp. CB01950]OKJ09172.1 glycosyl hydrolase [Kitasatospora sp. CB01950]